VALTERFAFKSHTLPSHSLIQCWCGLQVQQPTALGGGVYILVFDSVLTERNCIHYLGTNILSCLDLELVLY
jgi:hypothetical protein